VAPDYSEQLAALDALAAEDSSTSPVALLSAITGSAGVGKTALAVHWARRRRPCRRGR
jgi:predicted ribonuclease YlaK